MRQVTTCADNLVLLGEMVQAASDYIDLCQETLRQEDRDTVQLAYSLKKSLYKLEIQLRPRAKREDRKRSS